MKIGRAMTLLIILKSRMYECPSGNVHERAFPRPDDGTRVCVELAEKTAKKAFF